MEEMDYYEYEYQKKLTVGKVLGWIFKWAAYCLIAAVFIIIFIRIGTQKIPKEFSTYVPTEAAKAAAADGEFEILYQEPQSPYDERGYYHVSSVMLTPETGEVQFTVRYNERSTLGDLVGFYNLPSKPTGEVFIYMLTDQDGRVYDEYTVAAGSKPMYSLRRVIFDGINCESLTTLYLDVYYGDDVSTEGRMNASFVIYDTEVGHLNLNFSDYADSSLTFKPAPAYINNLGE